MSASPTTAPSNAVLDPAVIVNALRGAGINLCEDVASEPASNEFGAFSILDYVVNGTPKVESGKQGCDGDGGLDVISYHSRTAATAALNAASNASSSQDLAGWQYDNIEIVLANDAPAAVASQVSGVLDHLPGVSRSFGSTGQ